MKIVRVEGWKTVDAKYDCVRWMFEKTRNRTGKPRGAMRAGRTVGYAETAEPTEPSRRYRRRVFYVKDNDRSEPDGQYQDATPHEAVDPRTLRPGAKGELTDRARGRRVGKPSSSSAQSDPSDRMLF